MQIRKFLGWMATLTALSAALGSIPAGAQAAPSAYGPGSSVWVGTEFSNMSASFPYQSGQRLGGVGAFIDFDPNHYLGLEGDARWLKFGGFEGSTETSYLVGPKAFFLQRRRFRPYGKLLIGAGKIHYPFAIGDATYFALAPGAGTEYRLSHRWRLRVEYEYQMWLSSPGYANEPNHELTPNGFQIGVMYGILR